MLFALCFLADAIEIIHIAEDDYASRALVSSSPIGDGIMILLPAGLNLRRGFIDVPAELREDGIHGHMMFTPGFAKHVLRVAAGYGNRHGRGSDTFLKAVFGLRIIFANKA